MILGQHTLADLQALTTAADREIAGLGRGYTALVGAHLMPIPWTDAWEHNFAALRTAYADARRPAMARILAYKNTPNVRTSSVPAEAEYAAVLRGMADYKRMRAMLATAGAGTASFGGDPDHYPADATVTTHEEGPNGYLALRDAPGGTKIDDFAKGTAVMITGPAQGGFFPVGGYGVSGSYHEGFSSATYITQSAPVTPGPTPVPTDPSVEPTPAPTGSMGTITTGDTGLAGRLKVRSSPDATGNNQVGKFAHGQTVSITGPAVAGFYPLSGIGEISTDDNLGPQGPLSGYGSAQFVTPIAITPVPAQVDPPYGPPAPPYGPPSPSPAPPAPPPAQVQPANVTPTPPPAQVVYVPPPARPAQPSGGGLAPLPNRPASPRPLTGRAPAPPPEAPQNNHRNLFLLVGLAAAVGGGVAIYKHHKKAGGKAALSSTSLVKASA